MNQERIERDSQIIDLEAERRKRRYQNYGVIQPDLHTVDSSKVPLSKETPSLLDQLFQNPFLNKLRREFNFMPSPFHKTMMGIAGLGFIVGVAGVVSLPISSALDSQTLWDISGIAVATGFSTAVGGGAIASLSRS